MHIGGGEIPKAFPDAAVLFLLVEADLDVICKQAHLVKILTYGAHSELPVKSVIHDPLQLSQSTGEPRKGPRLHINERTRGILTSPAPLSELPGSPSLNWRI